MCPRAQRSSEYMAKLEVNIAPVFSIPQQGDAADSLKPSNHLAFDDPLNTAGIRVHSSNDYCSFLRHIDLHYNKLFSGRILKK